MPGSVNFIIGNTHEKLSSSEAPLSSNGIKKKHDVTIYVDVLSPTSPDLIAQVVFDLGGSFTPQKFIHSTPVPIKRPSGARAWRFATRQQVYATFTAHITIRGNGGSGMHLSHEIRFVKDTSSRPFLSNVETFTESRPEKPLQMAKLSSEAKFGVELEMSSPPYITPQDITLKLTDHGVDIHNSVHSYSDGRIHRDREWKLVPDGSIVCNTSEPDCNRFELVSPPLISGPGLSQISSVLKTLDDNFHLKVNKSMGFHVHIDASKYSLGQLIKICQQFCKYEDAIDTIMPRSRRTGSENSNRYFQSNARAISEYPSSIWSIHNRLERCTNTQSLTDVMNPDGRYYKLNLQNLKTGRQSTLEFRQHSSTTSYEKVGNWIRFLVRFCDNSAVLRSPTPFQKRKSLDEQFDALFHYVIKDRALYEFYKKRRSVLRLGDEHDDACCSDCVLGRGCSS